MTIGRRRRKKVNLAGRPWNEVAREVQDALNNEVDIGEGVPGGFRALTPVTVLVGGTASAGTEAASWMASDAQLVITGGTPVDLGDTTAPGGSTAVADRLHVHARRLGVKPNGGATVIERDLNLVNTSTVTWTAILDTPNKEVEVRAEVNQEQALLYALVF